MGMKLGMRAGSRKLDRDEPKMTMVVRNGYKKVERPYRRREVSPV